MNAFHRRSSSQEYLSAIYTREAKVLYTRIERCHDPTAEYHAVQQQALDIVRHDCFRLVQEACLAEAHIARGRCCIQSTSHPAVERH